MECVKHTILYTVISDFLYVVRISLLYLSILWKSAYVIVMSKIWRRFR